MLYFTNDPDTPHHMGKKLYTGITDPADRSWNKEVAIDAFGCDFFCDRSSNIVLYSDYKVCIFRPSDSGIQGYKAGKGRLINIPETIYR